MKGQAESVKLLKAAKPPPKIFGADTPLCPREVAGTQVGAQNAPPSD